MTEKVLSTVILYKNIIKIIIMFISQKHYLLSYIFLEFLCHKLQRLFEQNFCWITLPDAALKYILNNLENIQDKYIDYNSCILANLPIFKKSTSSSFYVNSMVSKKKYKLIIVPVYNIDENTILISEIMQHNLQNVLSCEQLDKSCFLLPLKVDIIEFATEARISLIVNSYNCSNEIMDILLENYFSFPRYLHINDIFNINATEYAQDRFYLSIFPKDLVLHFIVKSLKIDHNNTSQYSTNGCYVVRGISTLIQEAGIHNYVPPKHIHLFSDQISLNLSNQTKGLSNNGYPIALIEPLTYLESCIIPFVKKDIEMNIKPIFLLKGPRGCGKSELIQIVSEKIGMSLYGIDFAEVQTTILGQTENKLRTVLQNAKQYVPCILYLNNIQIFGKTVEGQKDERIISSFATEIAALYDTPRPFPLIVIATSDETDIPAELQRIFIETIHMKHLNKKKREELLSWFLYKRNLTTTADLSKVAGLCSDFRFADLLTLLLHATKFQCKLTSRSSKCSSNLTQKDFDQAYEYMQSIYSDSKGAPRVPKVYWEDIGGLAELKHEITRRIQLPLLNAFGFGQSGVLLYGPPGTGKTLLAKAVATEYQLHFLSIKGPEVLNMYVGQSEKNVREIFERARSASPCIIFFDELDSLAPNRGKSGDSGGVMDRVVSQLLAEMDGLEESSSIFIIGATNRPDLIDPALLRPGRFDKLLYVGIHSDRESKISVLKAQTRKFKLRENGQELELLADSLPSNVTGADLYSVSSNAWLNAVREFLTKRKEAKKINKNTSDLSNEKDNEAITNSSIIVKLNHFLDATRNLIPSVSDEDMQNYNKIQAQFS